MQCQSRRRPGTAVLLAAAAVLAAGCSGPSTRPADGGATASAGSAARRSLPALPPAGSGRGGYYQDDGPGDNPPENLWDIPDAEPRIEPYANRGNKPYVVFGKTYTPQVDEQPAKQRGRGSWYGKKFHGQKTSSGEPYDMYKMTAAHPTWPIPSYARVTNLGNNRSVVVRVNDRGPFHSDRIIDLSYTAALKLGYIGHGSAMLEAQRILPDEIREMELARNSGAAPAAANVPAQPSMPAMAMASMAPAAMSAPAAVETGAVPMPLTTVSAPAELLAAPVDASAPPAAPVAASASPDAGPMSASGFYLQLGAFSQAANAHAARMQHAQRWSGRLQQVDIVENNSLFRLYGGPFNSRADAEATARQMQASGGPAPIVVQR
nr:septal ring lytic transglycosylase RlpA family protein [uncultured Noviherbaspirillum sp.]